MWSLGTLAWAQGHWDLWFQPQRRGGCSAKPHPRPFSRRPLSLGSGGASSAPSWPLSRQVFPPSQQPEGGVSGFPEGWTPHGQVQVKRGSGPSYFLGHESF